MSRVYIRNLSEITLHNTIAVTTGTPSALSAAIDTTSGGNGNGCEWIDLYVDITSTNAATGVLVYQADSIDGTNYTEPVYCMTIPTKDIDGAATDGKYGPFSVFAVGPYTKFSVDTITASASSLTLTAVPRYHADV